MHQKGLGAYRLDDYMFSCDQSSILRSSHDKRASSIAAEHNQKAESPEVWLLLFLLSSYSLYFTEQGNKDLRWCFSIGIKAYHIASGTENFPEMHFLKVTGQTPVVRTPVRSPVILSHPALFWKCLKWETHLKVMEPQSCLPPSTIKIECHVFLCKYHRFKTEQLESDHRQHKQSPAGQCRWSRYLWLIPTCRTAKVS